MKSWCVFYLLSIYGPNRDEPSFFTELINNLNNFDNYIIMTGDFNLVIEPSKDSYNYVNINNPNAREKVLQLMTEYNLIDCWREMNAEQAAYTWTRPNSNKTARLDYVLKTEELYGDIVETKVSPGYRTDHSMILLSLKFTKGHSFWKFYNSLLHDIEYVTEIKKVIYSIELQYASAVQTSDQPIEDISPNGIVFLY